MPRIMTGVILAAGRGFGEAAALLYTAGMSTDIVWSNWNIFPQHVRSIHLDQGKL